MSLGPHHPTLISGEAVRVTDKEPFWNQTLFLSVGAPLNWDALKSARVSGFKGAGSRLWGLGEEGGCKLEAEQSHPELCSVRIITAN